MVELEFPMPSEPKSGQKQEHALKSVYVGWTGFSSHRRGARPATVSSGARYGTSLENQGIVEIDATFGRLLGLSEHLKVGFHEYTHHHFTNQGLGRCCSTPGSHHCAYSQH